jgi:hypothetical protein
LLPAPPGTAPAPVLAVDINARLADPIPAIDFSGTRLIDAVRLLAQMSTVPINFDLEVLGQLGVALDDPVTVHLTSTSVGETLSRLLESRGLTFVVQKGQILVSSPDRSRDALRPVGYTVSDLIGPDANSGEQLSSMVRSLIAPETWQPAGGKGTIEASGGVLRVVQTDAVHRQVLVFCEKLRVARGLPPRSRFDPKRFTLETRLDAARAKLAQTVTVNFREQVPLERITSELEEMTGTKIVFDGLGLAEEGKTPRLPASLQVNGRPLGESLGGLARSLGLAIWIADGSTFQITTRRAAAGRLQLEFFPVGDLLVDGMTSTSLIERIKDQTGGGTWNDAGGPGVMCFDEPSQTLIVLQSQTVQAALETLLGKLRAEAAAKTKHAAE